MHNNEAKTCPSCPICPEAPVELSSPPPPPFQYPAATPVILTPPSDNWIVFFTKRTYELIGLCTAVFALVKLLKLNYCEVAKWRSEGLHGTTATTPNMPTLELAKLRSTDHVPPLSERCGSLVMVSDPNGDSFHSDTYFLRGQFPSDGH